MLPVLLFVAEEAADNSAGTGAHDGADSISGSSLCDSLAIGGLAAGDSIDHIGAQCTCNGGCGIGGSLLDDFLFLLGFLFGSLLGGSLFLKACLLCGCFFFQTLLFCGGLSLETCPLSFFLFLKTLLFGSGGSLGLGTLSGQLFICSVEHFVG